MGNFSFCAGLKVTGNGQMLKGNRWHSKCLGLSVVPFKWACQVGFLNINHMTPPERHTDR